MFAAAEFVHLLFFYTVSLHGFQPQKYHERFHQNQSKDLARVMKHFPHIREAAKQTNTPPYLILGTIYTESNAQKGAVGDGGRSYGMGQIWCTKDFNWLGKFGIAKTCQDYFNPRKSMLVVAHILEYAKNHYNLTWEQSVEVYHQGHYTGDDWAYRNRVQYFGKLFVKYYRDWKDIKEMYGAPKVQR